METKKKGFPIAFWLCAGTEIFERLSYYLGRSLILIFVTATVATGGLGLSDTVAANMQSNLTAFSYLLPLFGAVIVDRYVGAKYTTPLGMVIAGVGYFMGGIATSATGVYLMIFFVSLGLALFKNGAIIGRVITDKAQMDPAFSMRYTLVNVGAFIGTFLVGILYKDVFAKGEVLGFAPCFKLAGLVMVLGALWYVFVCWPRLGEVGKLPFKKTLTKEELEAEAKKKEEKGKKQPMTTIEKKRIGAILIASLFSIVFWIFWYLGYMPVYFYWAENMNWVVAGYEVPSTWFDAANSFFCVVLGPITAALWKKLAARPQGDMSLFRKTGLGIAIIGVGYLFYAVIDIVRGGEKASVLWLIIFAFLLTLGEMFFSPLGHSFISKYSPSRYLALMMSMWGFATFIAAKSYGPVYGILFGGNIEFKVACIGVAIVSFVAAVIMIALDKRLAALVD
ncbi:peptide MFS transporter [Bariatricus sp. SGI.154]|uniref:peptide MFS transporter n=1 Tax=Bariatricus sp. SGI.154 TaxID=3420549 RepID=UPI003CFEA589